MPPFAVAIVAATTWRRSPASSSVIRPFSPVAGMVTLEIAAMVVSAAAGLLLTLTVAVPVWRPDAVEAVIFACPK